MTEVTVREFSYNPSAIFARVERGERIEVTRHGKVIAVVSLPERHGSRYDELVSRGLVRPGALTTSDLDKYTHITTPDGIDPLESLAEIPEERDLVEMLDLAAEDQ
jgi:prevent-host-death family protein